MQAARIAITAARGAAKGFSAALSIAPDIGGPFAVVKGATSGIAAGPLPHRPIDDPQQPGLALTALRVLELQAQRRHLDAVGRFMRGLLGQGKLLAEWDKLRQAGPLRTWFAIDPRLPELQALPWERLADDGGGFPALDPGSSVFRAQALPSAATPMDWPIRVLVASCAEPDVLAAQQIGADAERLEIERLFASAALRYDVEYDVLEHPSVAQIIEWCRKVRPHVLHFIGHGRGDGPPGQHALSLWRPGTAGQPGAYEDWPLVNIAVQLKGIAPRVAFLNACRTGAGWSEPAPVASLDEAFLRAGSAATVAMQGDIAGDIALEFSKACYRGLLSGGGLALDLAVQQARWQMTVARPGAIDQEPDWSLPRLTLAAAPAEVLPRPPRQPLTTLAQRFVARLPERREAHEAVRCCPPASDKLSRHLLLIVGAKLSGKSHLARWTAQASERAGSRVARIEFNPEDKVDWLEALRWIRDDRRRPVGAPPSTAPGAPLPSEHFRDFNWGLNRRQRGITAFEPTPAHGPVPDDGLALTEQSGQTEDLTRDTLASFRDALGLCAEPDGLLLVLDQLQGLDTRAMGEVLMEHLFKPVAGGAVDKLRLILVLDEKLYKDLRVPFTLMERPPRLVEVPLFSPGDFRRLARQLCHQWSPLLYTEENVVSAIDKAAFGKPTSPPWDVQAFKTVDKLCESMLEMRPDLATP
ncbi:CHAT domain-containing protein [Ideonella sp. YS5]|uniref:CHAT domain-containing protein n=1 Tax=Ideonella sp. YS5 TaxID=3453714 RepID=UPI003EEB6BCB